MKNKNILITGGTGSFGKNFTKFLLKKKNVNKIVIYSRDEYKQYLFEKEIQDKFRSKVRFLIGDVRDYRRLNFAFKKIDYVIHAAALKQVPKAEYDPFEFVKTNIVGTQNIIEASIENKIKKVISLSTDKASSPINLYGATKLCSDKLIVAANNLRGPEKIAFSVVRYGNVLGSRGSLFPAFYNMRNNKTLPVTDKEMTRFNITLEESIKLVDWSLENSIGGEIFVPKLKSFKIIDFAKAISSKAKIKIIGIRPGEKIHEEMISVNDIKNTLELNDKFIICPELLKNKISKHYKKFNVVHFKGSNSYNSNQKSFMTIKEIGNLLKKNFKYLES